MGKSSSHDSTAKVPAKIPQKTKTAREKPVATSASGHAVRSLLFVFGGMLLGLITAGFLVIALMLPIQIGSRLDAEFSKEIIPLFSTGFEQFNNEIKTRLEKQMGASVQQVEKAFESENKSKAAFLAKSLLPLIEGFDLDGVTARVKQYLSENDSVKGIRYRTDGKGNWTTAGIVSGGDLRMFQAVEKTKFAHAEIELHVSPAGLEEARKRQGGVFQEILSATGSAKNELVQNATRRTNEVRSSIAGSLAGRIVLLALVIGAIVIAASLFLLNRMVIAPLREAKTCLLEIAGGDLSRRIEIASQNEVGEIAGAGNRMADALGETVRNIRESTAQLVENAEEFLGTSRQMVDQANTQTARTETVATSMTEMSQTIMDVARHAADAQSAARDASDIATQGRKAVLETASGMQRISDAVASSARVVEQLGERGHEIGSIVSVIDDIADQTNLLALNAAIEAARAGDQGRGFAVVADEVRKLAERTSAATKQIAGMIEMIQNDTRQSVEGMEQGRREVENGVQLAEKAREAMDRIVSTSSRSMDMIQSIATATEQQSATAEDISRNMEQMAEVTHSTEDAARRIEQAARNLSDISDSLNDTVGWFKMDS